MPIIAVFFLVICIANIKKKFNIFLYGLNFILIACRSYDDAALVQCNNVLIDMEPLSWSLFFFCCEHMSDEVAMGDGV